MNRIRSAVLLMLVLSAAACQSRLGRAVTFWKHSTPDAQAQANGVQAAILKETSGSYDPRFGDPQVPALETRLKIDPQNAAIHLELAQLYEKYSLQDMALDQYTRAYNLNPESLDALRGMARIIRHDAGKLGELLPKVRAFAEAHAGNAVAIATLASLLDDVGDLVPAEKLYKRALEIEPKASYLHNNLGFNLLLQGRTREAVPEFRRALELNPKSQTARNNLGVALARHGDRHAALRVFSEQGVDPATAHNNLAVALLEQDRLEESRAELMESLAARNFFQPALENFKLLLEKDQDRQARPFTVPYRPALPLDWMRTLPKAPILNPPEKD